MDYTHMSKRELKRTDLYKASLVPGKHKLTKPELLLLLQKEATGRANIVKAYTDLYPVKEALNRYLQPTPSVFQLKLSHQLRIVRLHELFKGTYTKVDTQPGLLTFNDASPQGCIWSRAGKIQVKDEEKDCCTAAAARPFNKEKDKDEKPNESWERGTLFPKKKPLDVLRAFYTDEDEYWDIYEGNLAECQLTQKFINTFVVQHLERSTCQCHIEEVEEEEEEGSDDGNETDEGSDEEVKETVSRRDSNDTVTSEGYFSCEENLPEFDPILGQDMEFGEKLSEYRSFKQIQTQVSKADSVQPKLNNSDNSVQPNPNNSVQPKFNDHTFLMFFTANIPQIQNLVLISREKVGKFVVWKIVDSRDKDDPVDIGRAVLLETPEITLPCGGAVVMYGDKGRQKIVSEFGIFLDHAFHEQ